jgi:hypothetical protein
MNIGFKMHPEICLRRKWIGLGKFDCLLLGKVHKISDHQQSWWYEEGLWKGLRSAGGR